MNMKNRKLIILSLLSIFLWICSALYYTQQSNKVTPQYLASTIQNALSQKQELVNKCIANKDLMNRLWQNALSAEDLAFFKEQDFVLHFYENGFLTYWNSNSYPISEIGFSSKPKTIAEHGNVFLFQSLGNSSYPKKRINFFVPIYLHYDISNDYIQSGFAVSKLIPNSARISLNPQKKSFAIKSLNGETQFYFSIPADEIPPYKPDWILLCILLGAFLSSVFALQLVSIHFSRLYSPFLGIGLIILILSVSQLLIYYYGLPFHLQNFEIYSPTIFASNRFLPSFGHLFFHVLSIYWVLSLVLAQVQKRSKNWLCQKSKKFRWLILIAEVFAFLAFAFYLQYLGNSLVLDSDISFDTNTFDATDKFTILALIILAFIARIFYLKLQLASLIISNTIGFDYKKFVVLFLLIFVVYIFYHYFFGEEFLGGLSISTFRWLDLFAIFWSVSFMYYLCNSKFKNILPRRGMFLLIFISVYFSLLFALYFKSFIDYKEKNITRISFAEKLSRQQDADLEFKFDSISEKISKDSVIQDWILYSDSLTIEDVLKHFRVQYAELFYNNYAQEIFLYDANKQSLFSKENISFDSLQKLKVHSIPTMNDKLFFRIDNVEHGAYLAHIPIFRNGFSDLLGYFIINFKLKQNIVQAVYPELLRNKINKERSANSPYNYAIYLNDKLINQSGSYNFDFKLDHHYLTGQKVFKDSHGFSKLYYKASPKLTYVVVYKNDVIIGVLTIFSFLFGIFLFISSIENWLSFLSASWIKGTKLKLIYNNSMSVRIKYFVLGFTGISFFIIGISTVLFLTNRYQSSSIQTIEETTNNLSESIMDYMHNSKLELDKIEPNKLLLNEDFAYFLTNIARQQKIDINIFDENGKLVFTTHDNIIKANILSRNMSFEARYAMEQKKLTSFLHPEKIGNLNYTASYAPLFRENGKFMGFLNIPFFFTKKHLDAQIISLITTLVNIYTILILISSFITFLFVNNLARSLNIVANNLKNVNLKKNELIHWPYRDEIGLLVEEYNKMVATVEKTARSLVLDERQSAWREMAQQVAHEIKNPLTPMKLNIQYLQQAVNANHPDIINLTKRVSSSIIEQIDNLNYIASEFSNFAKMPENKSERIDLKNLLENIVLLFSGDKNVTITHDIPNEPMVVFADRSQMLRIFTNIVQNAVESFDKDESKGVVNIQVNPIVEQNVVEIKVSDNGSGIPMDAQSKIFDPYFTTKSSGTGLGLAMSKKIIDLWGGTIRFESEQGVGTTFYLQIPMG